ncbi:ATP-binding protein [Breoghania sp.]|uniref:ATP-binding protein n=1 Tax=Breoghania sp. TaxID=2065378 RepID=UPI002620C83B|nr:ATP-binding protein [Breoghania sp.]MDJ0933356.1 ATP-binding protein [Breoghania sp.]
MLEIAHRTLTRSGGGTTIDAQPTLDDLPGLGEATAWGKDLAADLADWKPGRISWADVDRGVLLIEDPGTGKTTFARALANSCCAPLVVGSLDAWQAARHLGDLLESMRKCFAKARKQTPCILFIDEIDGFGSRTTVRGDNAGYQTQVINCLLEYLDSDEGREGVIVVGAYNHPEMLDPAIVRAGRLDRIIWIPMPDTRTREQILKVHLCGDLIDEDLGPIARLMDGMSSADLEKLIRDDRRKAKREHHALRLVDLSSSLTRIERLADDVLMRTAVHEAGHALVRHILCGDEILLIEVRHEIVDLPSSGGHLGRVVMGGASVPATGQGGCPQRHRIDSGGDRGRKAHLRHHHDRQRRRARE